MTATNPRRFWLKESRTWTREAVELIAAGDKSTEFPDDPHAGPPTEAGVRAMYAAHDYFKAYPDQRLEPEVAR